MGKSVHACDDGYQSAATHTLNFVRLLPLLATPLFKHLIHDHQTRCGKRLTYSSGLCIYMLRCLLVYLPKARAQTILRERESRIERDQSNWERGRTWERAELAARRSCDFQHRGERTSAGQQSSTTTSDSALNWILEHASEQSLWLRTLSNASEIAGSSTVHCSWKEQCALAAIHLRQEIAWWLT